MGTCTARVRAARTGLLALLLGLVAVLAGCSGGSSAALGGSTDSAAIARTAFRWWNAPWGSSVPYNPYATGYLTDAFAPVMLPLAYVLPAPDRFGTYYPELATSWTVSGRDITVHLRPSAAWQDGKPFTSKDVLVSLLLSGAELNQIWADLSGVTAPDAHTLVAHVAPGNSPQLVLDNLMTTSIVPAHQYQHLIPAGLQRDLVAYWKVYQPAKATNATIAAAAVTPAYKRISRVGAALTSFAPRTLIGDGPFQLAKLTNSEILLKKWARFWDAAKITAPWAIVSAMNDSSGIGALLTGRMDFDDTVRLTTPLVERVHEDPSLHYVIVHTNVQQEGLMFNVRRAPLDDRRVRQAIAHVIDRKKFVALDVGGAPAQNVPVARPAGIHETLEHQFLSEEQLKKLDPYTYDPGEAARLLTAAGFTRDGGDWHLPDGRRFRMTIDTQAASSVFETDANILAQDLKTFGIDTSVDSVPQPAFAQRQLTGQFAVSLAWVDYGTSDPLSYFNQTLVEWNYPASWNGHGSCSVAGSPCRPAIGIGPFGDVPGLGKVNLAQSINYQLFTTPPGPRWRRLTWSWAQYINRELPILPIDNNAIHEGYSTKRYTHWPPDSSKLWSLYGSRQILYFMQHGYLRLIR